MNIRAKVYGGAAAAEESILKAKRPRGAKADSLDSVAVQREAHRASNNRGEDRHRLTDERARLTHNGADVEVELINLSGGGAMVSADFTPMLWDRVELHLGNHGMVECAVRWIRGNRIGLEFAHETRLDCPSGQFATVLRHVIERTFPHIEFPPPEAKATQAAPDEPADAGDHRRAPRHPLIWSGTLYHDYQTTSVRVRNISATGAMIESATPVRIGAQPLLELNEKASVSATVEWVVGDQVGLRFNEPFDMGLLAESRPTVAPVEWMPPPYLKVAGKTPPDGDHWNRLTLEELRRELEGFLKR